MHTGGSSPLKKKGKKEKGVKCLKQHWRGQWRHLWCCMSKVAKSCSHIPSHFWLPLKLYFNTTMPDPMQHVTLHHTVPWLIDWLMITYLALFSALLSRLTALACGSTGVTSFSVRVFWISTEVVYLSAGMADATWNCSHLGASSVYTINHAPCHFMQSHIRKVYASLAVTCHLHFWQNGIFHMLLW